MATPIHGQDVIIDIYKVDGYRPWICAENIEMDKSATEISVKTVGDGPNAAYRMRSKGYGFTVSGLIPYDDAVNVTAFDILDRYENMLAVQFRMVFRRSDTGAVVKAIYGSAYIKNVTFSGPADFARGSVQFLGTGPTENLDGLTACDAVITGLTLNSQTSTAATFGYTGATLATRFDYTIEGTVSGIVFFSGTVFTPALPAGTFTASPIIPNGGQTIRVTPICANGEAGTPISLSFTKT